MRTEKTDTKAEPSRPFGMPGRPGGPGGMGGPRGPRGMIPVAKPKDFKGTIIKLVSYFKNEYLLLLAIFIMIVASSLIGLRGPYLVGRAIDAMEPGKDAVEFGVLSITITALTIVYVLNSAITFLQGWIMAGVSQRIVYRLRTVLFAKLQKLPLKFFDTRPHGEVMSRLTNDIDNVSFTLSQSVTQLMASVITIVGSLVMMIRLSPLLTLVSMITVPLVFILTRTIARKTRILFKEQQATLGKLNGHIEEAISGLHIVKAFNHEEKSIEVFEEYNSKLQQVGIKAQIWSGFLMPLMNVISNLGFVAIAAFGGILAVNGLITVGVIASFISYSKQFTRPLNEIANTFNTIQSAIASAERVFEILDEVEEPADVPGALELKEPKGNVVFKDVSFGYRPDVPILKNINFEAKKGSRIALVGPTGAGKTTIVNLLVRFYDTLEGEILIDGRNIKDYKRESLMKCFSIVLQDTYLFSGTIRENIRYGRLDATDEEVEEAARMANADTFIKRLPKGYDTELSESGGNLSQGQRQLLAIARAFLARPAILILDEATSNVDTRTELNIQEALLKLMSGCTSFIIAHRLSTIRNADVIMVINDGRIIEKGNHETLMAKKGFYYELYSSQFGEG
ncbi:MAG TPA: ABC transporter ATP-binding protein [Clostridiaceae bacterium]|nr:ABC transporter ATP-binding protein [Clostridiaceae bacterium]